MGHCKCEIGNTDTNVVKVKSSSYSKPNFLHALHLFVGSKCRHNPKAGNTFTTCYFKGFLIVLAHWYVLKSGCGQRFTLKLMGSMCPQESSTCAQHSVIMTNDDFSHKSAKLRNYLEAFHILWLNKIKTYELISQSSVMFEHATQLPQRR